MDKIHEDKLTFYRRNENIIRHIEEEEAKKNEAIEAIDRKSASNQKSFGPANDLLRYLYILQKQYESDSPDIRAKTRDIVLDYFDQYQLTEEEEDNDEQQPEESEESQQPESVISSNQQLSGPQPTIPSQPRLSAVTPTSSQPSPAMSSSSQPTTTISSLSQTPSVLSSLLQQQTTVPLPVQPQTVVPPPQPSGKTHTSSSLPATDPDHIKPETLNRYKETLAQAQQYEKRYSTIDLPRKKQLASRIKDIMNKLRTETFDVLTKELFQFLLGEEQKVANQMIRVTTDDERLLCLSMLATLTLSQLLGGDLNDIKTKIFIPFVGILSEQPQHTEFSIIFLERLYKKCPYTIPCYPEKKPGMNDQQYLQALGYIEKQDGPKARLETDIEFLNRMSGLIRLFCKLLVRGGPPFDKDLSFAWTWCADVANLSPRSNISSILLRVYLDEAGSRMLKAYPNQFPKIIKYIQMQFLPRLERVTSSDEIARFRLTLDTFINK